MECRVTGIFHKGLSIHGLPLYCRFEEYSAYILSNLKKGDTFIHDGVHYVCISNTFDTEAGYQKVEFELLPGQDRVQTLFKAGYKQIEGNTNG